MYKLSAEEIRFGFVNGKFSAEEVTAYFLKRIGICNPKLNAFLTVFEEKAMKKAKELDHKRDKKRALGRLAGVPIAIKDNTNVKGEITSCGSKFLKNFRAPLNATVVDLLENEDAIIVGKTNIDEFSMGSSTENSAFFPTYNPWDLSRSPGGSSGGSSAATAARIVPLATGSDTGGSIRQPCALSGVVGFKPTYGRVSRNGLVAFASSLDQIGAITTNVRDAGLMMEVMGHHCPHDSTSLKLPPETYLENIPKDLKGKTVGIPRQFLSNLKPATDKNFENAVSILKGLGAQVIDINLDLLKYSIAIYYILATAEASTNLARFDGIRYGLRSTKAKNLEEVYDFSRDEGFGPEVKRRILLGTYVLSGGYQEAFYKKALKMRRLVINACNEAFTKCDMICLPTTGATAFQIGAIQDPIEMYLQDVFTIGANLAGIPAIAIPSGFDEKGLPFSIQLMGPVLHDVNVVRYAATFEKAANFNKIPPLFDKEF